MEPSLLQEFSYFIFVFRFIWLLPLLVMVVSYLVIFLVIYRRGQEFPGRQHSRSDGGIGRAKLQTVKVTGVLILGYVLCWTPYNVMALWLVEKAKPNSSTLTN